MLERLSAKLVDILAAEEYVCVADVRANPSVSISFRPKQNYRMRQKQISWFEILFSFKTIPIFQGFATIKHPSVDHEEISVTCFRKNISRDD
jgi:hypothetical protein